MAISKPPKTKGNKSNDVNAFIKGKKSNDETTQISLKLPAQLLRSIDDRAEELSISRAAFIKQSCALFLEDK